MIKTSHPKTVAFIIYPGFQTLDVSGPMAALEIAGRHGQDGPVIRLLAARPGPIASSAGPAMLAEDLCDPTDIDTLIVAGGIGIDIACEDSALLDFVKAAAGKVRRLASVCSGALLLARAGLLDGKRATTHWGRTMQFQAQFPKVRLTPDRIHVRDGMIWTSAGITAGIDMALAMIAEDMGAETARHTARQLVVYHQRPGGQSQFSALLEMRPSGDGRFMPLLGWLRENLHRPLRVEDMADQAGMSPRNFARAFTAETGMTPAKALERLRLESARAALEGGGTLTQAARICGFGDGERMRRAFVRVYGETPRQARQRDTVRP